MKTYLGDGVYADCYDNGFILYTDYGEGPQNTILIEPEVYDALVKFVELVRGTTKEDL